MMAIGVAIILFGALWDRERAKRDVARLASPPDRSIPGYARSAPPTYVTDTRPTDAPSLALTDARRSQLAARIETATEFPVGMAAPEFVSDPPTGWAVLDDPSVLVCADRIETLHELLPSLERMILAGRGLVIVAPDLARDVQETLVVNHLHRTVRLLAVRADGELLADLAGACGATPLSRADLQAGWLPEEAFGSARTWLSTKTKSWSIAT